MTSNEVTIDIAKVPRKGLENGTEKDKYYYNDDGNKRIDVTLDTNPVCCPGYVTLTHKPIDDVEKVYVCYWDGHSTYKSRFKGKLNTHSSVSVYYWSGDETFNKPLVVKLSGEKENYYTTEGLKSLNNSGNINAGNLQSNLDKLNCENNGAHIIDLSNKGSPSPTPYECPSCGSKQITVSGPQHGTGYSYYEHTLTGGSDSFRRFKDGVTEQTGLPSSKGHSNVKVYHYSKADNKALLIHLGNNWYRRQDKNSNNWEKVQKDAPSSESDPKILSLLKKINGESEEPSTGTIAGISSGVLGGGGAIGLAVWKGPSLIARLITRLLSNVVNSISWCPENRVIAVSTEDGHISLVDTQIEGSGKIRYFDGHTNIAQGVALDPKNELLASLGSDQCLRIWKRRNQKSWKSILVLKGARDKGETTSEDPENTPEIRRYGRYVFMSEELKTFFRRLDWSPDGRILVAPTGIRNVSKEGEPTQPAYTLYMFYRKLINFGIPMITHQSPTGPFVVVRFCPIYLSTLDKQKNNFLNKLMQGNKNAKLKPVVKKSKATEKTGPLSTNKIDSYFGVPKTEKIESVDVPAESSDKNESHVEENTLDQVEQMDVDAVKIEQDVSMDDEPVKDESMDLLDGEKVEESQAVENSETVKIEEEQIAADSQTPVKILEHEDTTSLPEMIKMESIDSADSNNATEVEEMGTQDEETVRAEVDETANEDAEQPAERAYNLRKRTSVIKPIFFDNSIRREPRRRVVKKPKQKEEVLHEEDYDTDLEQEVTIPRFIFATGTVDGSVCFYDTNENGGPIAVLKNLHFCPITDISWSPDGYVCASSSSDGYITFVIFNKRELS